MLELFVYVQTTGVAVAKFIGNNHQVLLKAANGFFPEGYSFSLDMGQLVVPEDLQEIHVFDVVYN